MTLLMKALLGAGALWFASALKKDGVPHGGGEITSFTGPSGTLYHLGVGAPNADGVQMFNVMNSDGVPLLVYAQQPGGPRTLMSTAQQGVNPQLDSQIQLALEDLELD